MNKLTILFSIDCVNNPSGDVAVICYFKSDVSYNTSEENEQFEENPAWTSANEVDIEQYKTAVDNKLLSIPLPLNIIHCNDVIYKEHNALMKYFHDKIAKTLELACGESIPRKINPDNSKKVCGWNDHVEHDFRNSLF